MALQCHKISSMKRFLSSNIPFRQSDPIKFEIWTLSGCSKQIDQFLRGLFGKQDSVLAQTLHGSSVSQNETRGKVFWFRQFTFLRKESNKIWNLDSFRILGTIYQFFLDLFGKQNSILAQALHGSSVSQNKTPVNLFGWGNLLFREKKAIKSEIWTLFAHWKQIDQFCLSLFGKHNSVLSQTFYGPSVSQNKAPLNVFWSSHLLFSQKKGIKSEIWTLFACWKQIDQFFFGLIWKSGFNFGPNFAWTFSATK